MVSDVCAYDVDSKSSTNKNGGLCTKSALERTMIVNYSTVDTGNV